MFVSLLRRKALEKAVSMIKASRLESEDGGTINFKSSSLTQVTIAKSMIFSIYKFIIFICLI